MSSSSSLLNIYMYVYNKIEKKNHQRVCSTRITNDQSICMAAIQRYPTSSVLHKSV